MREKFVPDFHESLKKAGIDESLFIEAMTDLVHEYEEKKARKEKANMDISRREAMISGAKMCVSYRDA